MKVLIIDNFDSFTFNLLHYFEQFVQQVDVIRYGNKILNECEKYDRIVISPGPGLPSDYPLLHKLVGYYSDKKPILGICLGLQAIAEFFGSELTNMQDVNHGIAKNTYLTDIKDSLFTDIPEKFLSGRYHSWIVSNEGLSPDLQVTAIDDSNNIMALKHKVLNIKGVQFHPESILTPNGKEIIRNWVYD